MAASTSVRRRLTISVSELSGSRPGADRFDIQIAARFASSNQFDSNSRSRFKFGSDKIIEKADFSFSHFPKVQTYLDACRSRAAWKDTPKLPGL
jgi:hypothetical protein